MNISVVTTFVKLKAIKIILFVLLVKIAIITLSLASSFPLSSLVVLDNRAIEYHYLIVIY